MSLWTHLTKTGYVGAVAILSGADEDIIHITAKLADARGIHILGDLKKPVAVDGLRGLLEKALC